MTERKYVIASNHHRYNDVRLQFWGEMSQDDAPRSFGMYFYNLNRCEKYTQQELEDEHYWGTMRFPIYGETDFDIVKEEQFIISLDQIEELARDGRLEAKTFGDVKYVYVESPKNEQTRNNLLAFENEAYRNYIKRLSQNPCEVCKDLEVLCSHSMNTKSFGANFCPSCGKQLFQHQVTQDMFVAVNAQKTP